MALSASDREDIVEIATTVATAVATEVASTVASDKVSATLEFGFTNVVLKMEQLIDNVALGLDRKQARMEKTLVALQKDTEHNEENINKLTELVGSLSEASKKNSETVTRIVTIWQERESASKVRWTKIGICAGLIGALATVYATVGDKFIAQFTSKTEETPAIVTPKEKPIK